MQVKTTAQTCGNKSIIFREEVSGALLTDKCRTEGLNWHQQVHRLAVAAGCTGLRAGKEAM